MSASEEHDTDVAKIYSSLEKLHVTLEDISILRSTVQHATPDMPIFHAFFLPHLPLLLSQEKEDAVCILREVYFSVSELSSSANQVVKTRYTKFGETFLDALDRVERCLQHPSEAHELQIMQIIDTVFRLFESLCCQEWGFDDSDVENLQENA